MAADNIWDARQVICYQFDSFPYLHVQCFIGKRTGELYITWFHLASFTTYSAENAVAGFLWVTTNLDGTTMTLKLRSASSREFTATSGISQGFHLSPVVMSSWTYPNWSSMGSAYFCRWIWAFYLRLVYTGYTAIAELLPYGGWMMFPESTELNV